MIIQNGRSQIDFLPEFDGTVEQPPGDLSSISFGHIPVVSNTVLIRIGHKQLHIFNYGVFIQHVFEDIPPELGPQPRDVVLFPGVLGPLHSPLLFPVLIVEESDFHYLGDVFPTHRF